MQNLTIAQVIEKNKLASNAAYVILAEIDVRESQYDPVVETLFITSNNEEIVYKGNPYTPIPFEIELRHEIGEAPSIELSLFDVTGAIRQRTHDYRGGSGFDVRIKVVSSNNLNDAPEIDEQYRVIKSSSKDYALSVSLGTENYLNISFPPRPCRRLSCAWEFRSLECGYAGPATSCSRRLDGLNGCREHQNTKRFGGFPDV